jgi:hypothetical protein
MHESRTNGTAVLAGSLTPNFFSFAHFRLDWDWAV